MCFWSICRVPCNFVKSFVFMRPNAKLNIKIDGQNIRLLNFRCQNPNIWQLKIKSTKHLELMLFSIIILTKLLK